MSKLGKFYTIFSILLVLGITLLGLGVFITKNQYSVFLEAIGFCTVLLAIIQYFQHQKTNKIEEYNFRLFKDIFSNLPDASVIYSLEDQSVIFVNDATKRYFKETESTLNSLFKHFPQIKDFDIDVSNIEVHLNTKDSSEVPFLVSIRHLNTVKKHIIITLKCVKEIKEKDEYIKSQNDSLVESSRFTALGEMASGFAHEINNPLTIILGNLSIMKIQLDTGKVNEERFYKCLEKSNDSIQRIVKTIKSLQKLANFKEAKQLHEVSEIIDVCESHIELFSEQFKYKFQTDVNVYVDKTQKLSINLNQISQSIGHLIKNGIEAAITSEKAWIQIDINEDENQNLVIDIIDSGSGIDRSMTQKIFNPMYTTKIEQKGAGVGLAITRSFITHNQGTIEVIPSNKHTTFRIKLPYFEELAGIKAA